MTLSLGLSLALFSLSLLEAAPGSWLLWLDNDNVKQGSEQNRQHAMMVHHGKHYYLSIEMAYRWVLWTMAVLCIVIVPSASGTQMLVRRADAARETVLEPEEQKRRSFTQSQERHWILRLIYRLVAIVLKILSAVVYKLLNFILLAPMGRLVRYLQRKLRNSYLPLVSGDSRSFAGLLRSPIIMFLRDPVYRKSALLGVVAGTGLALVVLIFLVTPLVIESSNGWSIFSLLDAVSWLCAVGILLSALLNGYGSVSMPYTCLAGLFLEPVHPDAIANAEIELEKTKIALEDKRKEISSVGLTLPTAKPPSNRRSLWRRVVRRRFSDLGDDVSKRKSFLASEIEFLETLVDELAADVDEMRHSQTVAFNARSPAGKVKSWIGVVFSVLLLARLFAAMSSVWNQYISGKTDYRISGIDPVTRILLWLMGHNIVEQEDLHTLSQFISLLISAVLSVSQMRNFIRTSTTVIRRTSSIYRKCYCNSRCGRTAQHGTKSQMDTIRDERYVSHLVAALMCCYCLACIVLTKMMLPYEYRAGFSAALGVGSETNELFKIRTYSVNLAFSLSALISAAVLAMILGIMRSNARRYAALKNTSLMTTKAPAVTNTSPSQAEP